MDLSQNKDKLDIIFEMQQALNEDIRERRNLEGISHEQWIQRHMLAMFAEMAEVLDEVNYKWWKNAKPLDENALKDELVDVLHFFVSMCLEAGMDADDLCRRYLAKNQENFLRQQGKSEKQGYAPQP